MTYNYYSLEELTTNITDGTHSTVLNDDNGCCYLLSAKNIKSDSVIYSDKDRRINIDTLNRLRKRTKTSINDVLISTVGTIGEVAQVSQSSPIYEFQRSVAILKPNVALVHPKYFYYLINNAEFKKSAINNSSGSVQKCLFLGVINKMRVGIFENLLYQEAIANILSLLDKKIELNNKINKNLEEMAQTLYKRWFVEFEFPNKNGEPYKSSGGDMVESELGLIPKGWNVESFTNNSLVKIIKSGIKLFDNEKVYLATANVNDFDITSMDTVITFSNRPSRANMQPIPDSVWFAKMKDSRKIIRISESDNYLLNNCIFSTGFTGIKCNSSLNFILSFILSKDFDSLKNNLSNGTTMQGINNDNLSKIKICIPKDDILQKYEKSVDSLYEKISHNKRENDKIIKIRDLLLPKLMSGEIRVPIEE